MGQRGRKRKNERYFDTREEDATIRYLQSSDETERNQIYEEFLKEPLYRMTEAIINRYNLHSKELSFDELLNETLSFLHTKVEKYVPDKGRAYSYFGTIIVRNLRNRQKKEAKKTSKQDSYDTVSTTFEEDEKYSYRIDEDEDFNSTFFPEFIKILNDLIILNEEHSFLKENELKVGLSILEILNNWESFFQDGGKKYNKNQILECIRNMTNLNTKEIRDSLKRFKVLYFEKKNERIRKDNNCDDSSITLSQSNILRKKR